MPCPEYAKTTCQWLGMLDDIQQWCKTNETSPANTEVIFKCLKAWQAGHPLLPYQGRDAMAHVYDVQRVIGWGCFLEGSLVKGWLGVQDTYFRMLGHKKTASVWARGLIKQLWKAASSLWLHCNSWQHSANDPQHQWDILAID